MQSVIDVASDASNSEYDWSLPFVTAQDEEVGPLKYELGSKVTDAPTSKVMYEVDVANDKFTWEGTDFKNRWYYEGK